VYLQSSVIFADIFSLLAQYLICYRISSSCD
jgi:hypothetical protein